MSMMDLFSGLGDRKTLTEDDVIRMVRKGMADDAFAKERKKTSDEMHEYLARMGGRELGSESSVQHHPIDVPPGKKISLPEGMTESQAAKTLTTEDEAKERTTWFYREFDYAFNDGLVAVQRVLRMFHGLSGAGLKQYSFFGEEDPQKISITIGLRPVNHRDGTITYAPIKEMVAASMFEFPALSMTVDFQPWVNTHGVHCLNMRVNTKVRFENSVQVLFDQIEAYLRDHSIYKGQMLEYVDGELRHIWLESDDTMVYSEQVNEALEDEIWGPIMAPEELAEEGESSDSRVLLFGPLGCGKTGALRLTAQLAHAEGMTVIVLPIEEDTDLGIFHTIFGLAETYGRSLVLAEDFNRLFPMSPGQLSKMQGLLEGLNSNNRVSVLMTTNFLEKIDGGVTRAPRVTGMIKIDKLDKDAIEQMMRKTLGDKLADDVDFEAVWEELKEYSPSFIKSAFRKANKIRIQRNKIHGLNVAKLDTDALVRSARSLKTQHEEHTKAVEAAAGKPVDHAAEARLEQIKAVMSVPEVRADLRKAVLGQ